MGNKNSGLKKNPNLKEVRKCLVCNTGFICSKKAAKKYCSHACSLKKAAEHIKNYHADPVKKKEFLKAMELRSLNPNWKNSKHFQKGILHPKYKGGKRYRKEDYRLKEWRNLVYKRDGYICQSCGKRGGKLEAHHIKSWSEYPELRYEVDNGKTLCYDCHCLEHGKQKRIKTFTCITCHKKKNSGRRLRCKPCGLKHYHNKKMTNGKQKNNPEGIDA